MSSKPTHILYADDDEDDHLFFKESFDSLKLSNYKISSVYDGAEVLEFLLKKGKYAGKDIAPPDFLILDLNMPVLDGYAILKEMISNPKIKSIPVYVLSVSDKADDEQACKELGCAGFYTKPVNFKKLTEVIQSILEKFSKAKKKA
jgi:two-component system response regulator